MHAHITHTCVGDRQHTAKRVWVPAKGRRARVSGWAGRAKMDATNAVVLQDGWRRSGNSVVQ